MHETSMNDLSPPVAGMTPITPTTARFIRLGAGSNWAKRCLAEGLIAFGDPSEPHDLCLAGDWGGVRQALKVSGRSKQDAGNLLRELQDFYTADGTCLWITIKDRRLWWGFAEPEVLDQRGQPDPVGIVARRIRWHGNNINGAALSTKQLSTRITQINGYQRTICGGA